MIDWAEPLIVGVCREVWRETEPQGLELADLHQEGRIAIFEAAQQIASAKSPQAMAKTVVRRRVYNALRDLAHSMDPASAVHAPHQADEAQAAG